MSEKTPSVLIIDDEIENLKALERSLRAHFRIKTTSSPAEALGWIEAENFDVVLSDQRMPEMSGTELLAKISSVKPHTTRVILTAYTETRELLEAINRAEIFRYIIKPWDNTELIATIRQGAEISRLKESHQRLVLALAEKNRHLETLNQTLEKQVQKRTLELQQANEKLSELAMTDPLTGVLNRRAFFQRFSEEIDRSTRYKHNIAVAMIDVDHFKPFNDMEGHVYGDAALKKIAQAFVSNIRKPDVLCRYGGEEFALMMPETSVKQATEICERLRSTVERTVFQGQKGEAYLTISVGLAGFPKNGSSPEELIKAADSSLYAAKHSGRNQIISQ